MIEVVTIEAIRHATLQSVQKHVGAVEDHSYSQCFVVGFLCRSDLNQSNDYSCG